MFKQNSSSACEDLLWMGPKAFCFYVQAAISYIQSADAEGDKSMARSFQHPVEHHWEYDREAVASVLPAICDALQYVIDNWAKFDDDEWKKAARTQLKLLQIRKEIKETEPEKAVWGNRRSL